MRTGCSSSRRRRTRPTSRGDLVLSLPKGSYTAEEMYDILMDMFRASIAIQDEMRRHFEQAVKAAAKRSGRDANKAIKGFYHDRFLCRVFSLEEPAFVLKGGQSMLAKIQNAREA